MHCFPPDRSGYFILTMDQFIKAAKFYLKMGLNCIVTNAVKQSLFDWKKYQVDMMTLDEFQRQAMHKNAEGMAVICGAVSGGLEVIDVDLKYSTDPTFYDRFTEQIGVELMAKLYIVKTKSNGYHFYYRSELVEGNQKLCYRYKTEDELKENPSGKKVCLIETRGEAGYVIAPPSDGYQRISDHHVIPNLSLDEREIIFSAARSLNDVIEEKPVDVRHKPEPKEYGVSPFDDYNKRGDVVAVLQQHGWTVVSDNGKKVQFRRPGNTTAKTSGNFDRDRNWFSVFTTNSIFEPEKAYQPYAVYAILEAGGDFRKAARQLADQGYGEKRVNYGTKIENEIFKRRRDGQTDKEITEWLIRKENKAVAEAEQMVQDVTKQWGETICTFWEVTDTGKINIIRSRLMDFIYENGGFCLYFHNESKLFRLVRVADGMVEESTTEQMKKYIKEYILSLPAAFDRGTHPNELLEVILKGSDTYFSQSFLEFLDARNLDFLKDEATKAYFPFRNGVVVVEKGKDPVLKTYGEIGKYVWLNQVIEFDIALDPEVDGDTIEYARFLLNVSGQDMERMKYAMTLIGYMLHGFKNPSRPYAPILAEETDDEKKGGGTGKGLFIKAIGKLIPVVTIDGKNFKIDKNFAFQRVGFDTKLVVIEDCPRNVDFEKFYPTITEGITIEKKNKDELFLPYAESPKIAFTTNYSISQDAEHAKRRQRIFEFASHYSSKHTPEDEFGHKFFDDWDRDEWNRFYNLFFQCVGMYLDNGILQVDNSEKMKRKHIRLAYGEEFLEYFDDLVANSNGWLQLTKEHTAFLESNNFEKRDYSIKRFRKALTEAGTTTGNPVEFQKNRQESNITIFRIMKDAKTSPDF